jgi:hypothetical protein
MSAENAAALFGVARLVGIRHRPPQKIRQPGRHLVRGRAHDPGQRGVGGLPELGSVEELGRLERHLDHGPDPAREVAPEATARVEDHAEVRQVGRVEGTSKDARQRCRVASTRIRP